MLAARWRLLDSGAGDGATNMATDHALLDRASETAADEAVLRIYAWERPTLSFGLHERSRIPREAFVAQGADAVRRPTGGRALLHHREVTYSVTAPVPADAPAVGLGESYREINALLRGALARLGVMAEEAPRRGRASAPDGAPCFAEPNVGELVVDGRKLVGSAQRRDARALLQHGSILLADDQGMIARLRGDARLAAPAAATLVTALGREVSYAEVRDALVSALAEVAQAPVLPLDPATLATRIHAHLPTYRSDEWTFRR
jgi:lipoyl(octanoyl) transferase